MPVLSVALDLRGQCLQAAAVAVAAAAHAAVALAPAAPTVQAIECHPLRRIAALVEPEASVLHRAVGTLTVKEAEEVAVAAMDGLVVQEAAA
jgi:hypothetical protein